MMSFQFGTNFSRFSQAVGPVIGPIIGLEVMSAFFLEAGFLGIMLFGWGRVGPKLHFAATCLVSIGTMISASFIMAANSWMQTPAGVTYDGRTFHVDNWLHVFFNPSFPYRAAHMLLAAWITAAFLVSGIAARYLLQRKHLDFARRCYSLGLAVACVALPLQLYLGDVLALDVIAPRQIAKIEALEGFWDTTPNAPWNVIIVPDRKAERNRFALSVPYLGSILVGKNLHTSIPGLKETPPDRRPNMWTVFYGFRLMYVLGTLMFCAAAYSVSVAAAASPLPLAPLSGVDDVADTIGIPMRAWRVVYSRDGQTAIHRIWISPHRRFGIPGCARSGSDFINPVCDRLWRVADGIPASGVRCAKAGSD